MCIPLSKNAEAEEEAAAATAEDKKKLSVMYLFPMARTSPKQLANDNKNLARKNNQEKSSTTHMECNV